MAPNVEPSEYIIKPKLLAYEFVKIVVELFTFYNWKFFKSILEWKCSEWRPTWGSKIRIYMA